MISGHYYTFIFSGYKKLHIDETFFCNWIGRISIFRTHRKIEIRRTGKSKIHRKMYFCSFKSHKFILSFPRRFDTYSIDLYVCDSSDLLKTDNRRILVLYTLSNNLRNLSTNLEDLYLSIRVKISIRNILESRYIMYRYCELENGVSSFHFSDFSLEWIVKERDMRFHFDI